MTLFSARSEVRFSRSMVIRMNASVSTLQGLTAHDFTRPLPLAPALRANLTQWLGRANTQSAEQFAAMSVPAEFRIDSCSTAFPAEVLSDWTDKTLAFRVVMERCEATSIIAVPNPLMQEFIARILGEQLSAQSAERELTPAESSIGRFIVETFAKNLNEAWQSDSPLQLKVDAIEPNIRRTRHFRPAEPFVDCRTHVKTPIGESKWSWFLSMEFLSGLFGLPSRQHRASDGHSSRDRMEVLIREMRAEVVVRLGGVQLTAPQMSALRVGDVVVLDQRVSEPLRGTIRGEPKFLGWAGRIGDRQAFEIESEIQSTRFVSPQSANSVVTGRGR